MIKIVNESKSFYDDDNLQNRYDNGNVVVSINEPYRLGVFYDAGMDY